MFLALVGLSAGRPQDNAGGGAGEECGIECLKEVIPGKVHFLNCFTNLFLHKNTTPYFNGLLYFSRRAEG